MGKAEMGKMYKCKKCGYKGQKLIFQYNDYNYCFASNEDNPDFIDDSPKWVKDLSCGESEIGEPIGCPKCHAWGDGSFEMI